MVPTVDEISRHKTSSTSEYTLYTPRAIDPIIAFNGSNWRRDYCIIKISSTSESVRREETKQRRGRSIKEDISQHIPLGHNSIRHAEDRQSTTQLQIRFVIIETPLFRSKTDHPPADVPIVRSQNTSCADSPIALHARNICTSCINIGERYYINTHMIRVAY